MDKFIIGGSWSSAQIVKVLSAWDHSEDLRDFDRIELLANDIDVCYGVNDEEGDGDAPLEVDLNGIDKFESADIFTVHFKCIWFSFKQ